MPRWLRCSALLIGGLLATGLLSAPAATAATGYDHQSPTHDWNGYTCADDAQVVSQTDVVSRSESKAVMGAVQVRYSPRCKTYWAQVFHYTDNDDWPHYWFSAAIVGGDGTDIYCQFAEPDGFTGGGCYTAMLDQVNGRKYQGKGIMFHQTNQSIVAYGQTPYVDGTGTATSSPVTIARAIMNGEYGSGTKYVWGGGHGSKPGPTTKDGIYGVDCSGFTRWVYSLAYGRDVLGAGAAHDQPARLTHVSSPAPGDLIFFGSSASNAEHVGVYIGGGQMINAPHPGKSVEQSSVQYDIDHQGFAGYYRYTG